MYNGSGKKRRISGKRGNKKVDRQAASRFRAAKKGNGMWKQYKFKAN